MDRQNFEYSVKEHSMSGFPDRKIFVYDNILPYSTRTGIYEMCSKSLYKINGRDNEVLENQAHISMVSTWQLSDFKATELLENLPPEIIKKHNLAYKYHINTMINMCTPHDRFHMHIDNDSNGWTMVYYANLHWNIEWGGDTCFLNEEGNDFEYVAAFKPGRLVFFHPQIAHMIRPPTQLATEAGQHFRFTLATKFIPYNAPPGTDGMSDGTLSEKEPSTFSHPRDFSTERES